MHPNHHRHHTDPTGARITVRGPAALAAALPYLIDAPLEGTIVLAGLDPDSTLGLTAHRSLPECPSDATVEVLRRWVRDVGRLAFEGVTTYCPGPDEYLALVIYLPPDFGPPPQWFSPLLRAEGVAGSRHVLDVVTVFGDRWRSVLCDDPSCCPEQGALIMDNSDAALVAAELVAAGLSAGGVPRPLPRIAGVGALLDAMPYPRSVKSRRKLLRSVWPVILDPPTELDVQMHGLLAMAADRPGVRDAILTRLAGLDAGPQRWQSQFDLWVEVTSGVPERWAAGPACMVAIAAWCMGEEGAAQVALEHALSADPSHRMATLIRQMLDKQLPPSVWFERMRGIDEADCLRFDRPPAADRRAPQSRAAG